MVEWLLPPASDKNVLPSRGWMCIRALAQELNPKQGSLAQVIEETKATVEILPADAEVERVNLVPT